MNSGSVTGSVTGSDAHTGYAPSWPRDRTKTNELAWRCSPRVTHFTDVTTRVMSSVCVFCSRKEATASTTASRTARAPSRAVRWHTARSFFSENGSLAVLALDDPVGEPDEDVTRKDAPRHRLVGRRGRRAKGLALGQTGRI